jgi:site-specific recombinase XerD
MTAYNAAVATTTVHEVGKTRSAPGVVSAAIASYYKDNRFTSLASGTQMSRRAILERFRADHGDKRLAGLQKQHVAAILGAKKPFAARNWLKALRGLMQFAVATGLIDSDPTTAFEPAKAKAGSIHTWTEAEIEQFEQRHPVGSRARLAMALLLYTGQRATSCVWGRNISAVASWRLLNRKLALSLRFRCIPASPRSSPRRNADTWPFW